MSPENQCMIYHEQYRIFCIGIIAVWGQFWYSDNTTIDQSDPFVAIFVTNLLILNQYA